MGQGEARPERILRRFFSILTDIYAHMHRLNREYLPKESNSGFGLRPRRQDRYVKIDDFGKDAGEFDFSFDANAFNTSKAALQQSALMDIMKVIVNPLALQLGRHQQKSLQSAGRLRRRQGPAAEPLCHAPKAQADQPRILAEEAITEIMRNQLPIGEPLEAGGVQEHHGKSPHRVHGKQRVRASEAASGGSVPPISGAGREGWSPRKSSSKRFCSTPAHSRPEMPTSRPGRACPADAASARSARAGKRPGELQDERLPGAGGGANGA
jgi:hypothetical protein